MKPTNPPRTGRQGAHTMPWIMDLSSDRPHLPLVGERTADVVVIGAGLTGLVLALRLAR